MSKIVTAIALELMKDALLVELRKDFCGVEHFVPLIERAEIAAMSQLYDDLVPGRGETDVSFGLMRAQGSKVRQLKQLQG